MAFIRSGMHFTLKHKKHHWRLFSASTCFKFQIPFNAGAQLLVKGSGHEAKLHTRWLVRSECDTDISPSHLPGFASSFQMLSAGSLPEVWWSVRYAVLTRSIRLLERHVHFGSSGGTELNSESWFALFFHLTAVTVRFMGCLYVLCLYYGESVFVRVCWKSRHESLKLLGSSDRRQLIQPSYFMSARMDVPRWSRCLISPEWTVPVISNHKSSSFPVFALRYVGFVNVFFLTNSMFIFQLPTSSVGCWVF